MLFYAIFQELKIFIIPLIPQKGINLMYMTDIDVLSIDFQRLFFYNSLNGSKTDKLQKCF